MYYLELEQIQIKSRTVENFLEYVDIFFPPHFMQILNQCVVSAQEIARRESSRQKYRYQRKKSIMTVWKICKMLQNSLNVKYSKKFLMQCHSLNLINQNIFFLHHHYNYEDVLTLYILPCLFSIHVLKRTFLCLLVVFIQF